MPVTRSAAAARNKVQDGHEDAKASLSSKDDGNETTSNGTMSANGKLPKTVKDDTDVGSDSHLQTKTAILLLITIFLTSAAALFAVYYSFPHLEP